MQFSTESLFGLDEHGDLVATTASFGSLGQLPTLPIDLSGPPLPAGLLDELDRLVDHPGDRATLAGLRSHPERIRGCAVRRDELRKRDVYEFQMANGQGTRTVSVNDAARIRAPRHENRSMLERLSRAHDADLLP